MSQIKYSTSSLFKNLLTLTLVIMVSSCGFKPLYAKKPGEKANSCGNFTVNKVVGFAISGQLMQYKLQDSLNQACIRQDNNYKVAVEVKKSKDAIAIQKNRVITRYNITLTGTFKVYDNSNSDKALFSGNSTMVGGFDSVISDYGVYALERDTEVKLLEEMSNDISLRISSVLLRKQ